MRVATNNINYMKIADLVLLFINTNALMFKNADYRDKIK